VDIPQSILHLKLSRIRHHLTSGRLLPRLIRHPEHSVDLRIKQREREGIVILDLKGRLVLGPEDVALRQRLQALRDEGHVNVALNLKGVSDMDTTALGTLVFCSMKFRDAGGRLVLFNLSPKHSQLSNLVKLNTAFEMYPGEVDALNSFFPERVVPHYDILEFVEELEQQRQAADLKSDGKNRNGKAKRESQKISK
jgi:anti-sigma B factor antagonist